jgi:hypothetical protein
MSGPIPWISFLMVQVLVSTTITVAGTTAVGEAATFGAAGSVASATGCPACRARFCRAFSC